MFAVPGWSISAKNLKAETESSKPATDNGDSSHSQTQDKNKSKKRKRGQDVHSGAKVTSENLEELWKRHIQPDEPLGQGNGVSDKSGSRRKQSKKERKKASRNADRSQTLEAPSASSEQNTKVAEEAQNGSREEDDGLTKYEKRMAKAKQKQEKKALQHMSNGEKPQEDGTRSESNKPSTSEVSTISSTSKAIPKTAKSPKPSTLSDPPGNGVKPQSGEKSKNTTMSPLPTPPDPKLTPLQQRMAQKLVSARFRHLNETLYTSPSTKAMALFTTYPQAYGAYHAGFRAQVSIWPSNPVDQFVQTIRERGAVRSPFRNGHRNDNRSKGQQRHFKGHPAPPPPGGASSTGPIDPLPRHPTTHICHIADLGCGDAVLAASLSTPPQSTRLKLSIRSFDLAQGDGPHASLVSVADITDLRTAGVADGSINIAICCLSLMSTNWVHVVDECARVVRGGGQGEVWVAEIKSRFVTPSGRGRRRDPGTPLLPRGAAATAEHGGKKRGRDVEEEYFSDLEENHPHQQHQQQQRANPPTAGTPAADTDTNTNTNTTDITAFVDVWRRRGFTLKGDPDLSNKMFVTMRFVKERWSTSTATAAAKAAGAGGAEAGAKGTSKFVDADADEMGGEQEGKGEEEEGKVLKPCLYKIR